MVRTIVSAAISGESSKYEEAVKKLNTLQSNAQTLEKIRKEKDRMAHLNIPKMEKFVERMGIQMADMEKLNVIHVSGTKGKGSTCAFCESILRNHGYKTGFFSSPHLVEVRERISLNGQPIDREKFATYFWEVYNQLERTKGDDMENMPNYFGFHVVMALHVFLQEKVDVAIMEVGIGGQYDSTNVVRNPLVCGVTSLGLDHVSVLGNTIDKIAWHKAGIFKPQVPAITAPQVPEAMAVLQSRADEIGSTLSVCPELNQYGTDISLGIKGQVQEINASLSLQLCKTWIDKYKEKQQTADRNEGIHKNGDIPSIPSITALSDTQGPNTYCDIPIAKPFHLNKQYYIGLEQCRWLGRSQKIEEPGTTFYLDGAHTIESIQNCVDWFEDEAFADRSKFKDRPYRVLIFNTTGDRDTTSLLLPLKRCHFDAVLFCPNLAYVENVSLDQTNVGVTKEAQIDRCIKNLETWEAIARTNKTTEQCVKSEDDKRRPSEINGDCVGYKPKASVNGAVDINECGEPTDKTYLQFFPSISHCVKWVRQRQWNCNDSKTNNVLDGRPTVINGSMGHANGRTDCDMDRTASNIANGDCKINSGAQNGETGLSDAHNGDTLHVEVSSREPHVQVLITGSLHLVGGALKVLWDQQ